MYSIHFKLITSPHNTNHRLSAFFLKSLSQLVESLGYRDIGELGQWFQQVVVRVKRVDADLAPVSGSLHREGNGLMEIAEEHVIEIDDQLLIDPEVTNFIRVLADHSEVLQEAVSTSVFVAGHVNDLEERLILDRLLLGALHTTGMGVGTNGTGNDV